MPHLRPTTSLPVAMLLAIALSGCASPPPPAPSVPAPASSPLVTAPGAASAPAPSPSSPPSGSPSVGPSPSGFAGVPPTTVRDAVVQASPPVPTLDSVAFADVATGWAAGSGVILGTTDGGRTWRSEWSGPGSVSSLAVVDRLHVWAVEHQGSPDLPPADSVVRTSDGGRTWTSTPLAGDVRDIAFMTDHTGWAVVDDTTGGPGRLVATTDGGLHWHASVLAAPVDAICVASASLGWAASGEGVYRTRDGGRHWTLVPTGGSGAPVNVAWPATVRCKASAAWVLWIGGGAAGSEAYRVARTLDGGTHWATVLGGLTGASAPPIDAYAGAFAAVSSRSALFLGVCPSCGYGAWSSTRTIDGGSTFSHLPFLGLTGASLTDVTFPDATHGWIAGWSGGGFLLATDDGGRTWHGAYPSVAARPVLDISFVSPTVGFGLGVIGDGRAVLRTDDGGATWRPIGRLPFDPAQPDRDPILSFVDADHGWAASVNGLLATIDGGRTWHVVPPAPLGGVAFADSTHGCAGTFGTQAARTVDGGLTWQVLGAADGLVACAASLVDPGWATVAGSFDPGNLLPILGIVGGGHAWAIGSLDPVHVGIEATADGGATWTAYRWPSLPDGSGELTDDPPARASFVSPTTGWLLTIHGHLFETTDGGASWREMASG
jgi:photosystem II stability/assembly factor-like uncharacterized protein